MNKKNILILLLLLLSCQNKNDSDKIDISSIPEQEYTVVQENQLDSIIYPARIHDFGKWLVGVNLPTYSKNVFDFIDKNTLTIEFSALKFGGGPNEVENCNPYFFIPEDLHNFNANTNNFFISSFHLEDKKISITKSKKLVSSSLNNLTKIDASDFLFDSSNIEKHYDIYDMKSERVISSFGNYPDIKISHIEEPMDYRNFFQTSVVFDPTTNQLFTFYINIPLIRIYKDYKLIKEIWTNDTFNTNIEDFYDNYTKRYYFQPYIRGNSIFVTYLGKNDEEFQKDSTINLLVFNTHGEIIRKYCIDKHFQDYTISEDGSTFYGVDNSNPKYTSLFKLNLLKQ